MVHFIEVIVTGSEMNLVSRSADVGDLWSGDGDVDGLVQEVERSRPLDKLQCLSSEDLVLGSSLDRAVQVWNSEGAIKRG